MDGKSCRNFKTKREPEEVKTVLKSLVTNELVRVSFIFRIKSYKYFYYFKNQYIERLLEIQRLCAQSSFFPSHELIGSSLLFVNDNCKASVWMIDFEKTKKYEGEIKHNVQWVSTASVILYLYQLRGLYESIKLLKLKAKC